MKSSAVFDSRMSYRRREITSYHFAVFDSSKYVWDPSGASSEKLQCSGGKGIESQINGYIQQILFVRTKNIWPIMAPSPN